MRSGKQTQGVAVESRVLHCQIRNPKTDLSFAFFHYLFRFANRKKRRPSATKKEEGPPSSSTTTKLAKKMADKNPRPVSSASSSSNGSTNGSTNEEAVPSSTTLDPVALANISFTPTFCSSTQEEESGEEEEQEQAGEDVMTNDDQQDRDTLQFLGLPGLDLPSGTDPYWFPDHTASAPPANQNDWMPPPPAQGVGGHPAHHHHSSIGGDIWKMMQEPFAEDGWDVHQQYYHPQPPPHPFHHQHQRGNSVYGAHYWDINRNAASATASAPPAAEASSEPATTSVAI